MVPARGSVAAFMHSESLCNSEDAGSEGRTTMVPARGSVAAFVHSESLCNLEDAGSEVQFIGAILHGFGIHKGAITLPDAIAFCQALGQPVGPTLVASS